jgi:NAD-dependent SIR2 family protein deacetylase
MEVKCPNCGNKMIYYNTIYSSGEPYYLAYCPQCKLGNKLIPGRITKYEEFDPDKIIRKLGGDVNKLGKNTQCNECGNEMYYYLYTFYKNETYTLGYCNKCGNIDIRDKIYLSLKFSFPYTQSFNPNYRMFLRLSDKDSINDNPFDSTPKLDKLKENVEKFKEKVISTVDEVISENFCIKYCVGNRDEYCDEIDCARNKIINKLKLKLKENGKLE